MEIQYTALALKVYGLCLLELSRLSRVRRYAVVKNERRSEDSAVWVGTATEVNAWFDGYKAGLGAEDGGLDAPYGGLDAPYVLTEESLRDAKWVDTP